MRARATLILTLLALMTVHRAPLTGGEDRPTGAKSTAAPPTAPQRVGNVVDAQAASDVSSPQAETPPYKTERMSGRLVWLADALKRRYNIETDADASESIVALDTIEKKLFPVVKDARGRAFFADARLRNVDMELVVRRFADVSLIQVIRVYSVKPQGTYEVDYWCDICAIPMYELKECECCQGPTRIRERKVDSQSGATTTEEPAFEQRLEQRR